MNNSLLSVVIPTYNAEPYLKECLDSLISQSYKNLEIICVNDGSRDDSLKILMEYAERDSRVQVIDVPNGGYGKAMNLGLKAASGKYFTILEPDDLLPAGVYEMLLNYVTKHSLDYAKGCIQGFVVNEHGIKVMSTPVYYPEPNIIMVPREHPSSFINVLPATVAGVYSMDFLKRNNIKYNETPGASYQDTGFYFQTTGFADRVMFLNEVVYHYRVDNPASSSNTLSSKSLAIGKEYKFVKTIMEQKSDIWKMIQPIFLACRLLAHQWAYSAVLPSFKKQYLNITREEFIGFEGYNQSCLSPTSATHFNELLVSVDYFLTNQAIRINQTTQSLNNTQLNAVTHINTDDAPRYFKWGITLLSKRITKRSVRFLLFGCIPLWERTNKNGIKRYKFLGVTLRKKQ